MDHPNIAEIFSQGDEVITGQIADTNAAWLAERLNRLGFDIARHSTVGDLKARLVGLLREIPGRADCCICTGGLGPTVDDLTAEAVAAAFDLPLALDPAALTQIERYFAHRGYPMPAINRKQALIPRGARRLDNRCGTAPGFELQYKSCYFAFLPGVPGEMKAMFEQQVEPVLRDRFRLRPSNLVTLRVIGLGESSIQERLAGLDLPASVRLGFRALAPENQVKLLFPADFPSDDAASWVDRVAALIGEAVFSIDGVGNPGGTLLDVAGRALTARSGTLAIAETASAGRLAGLCGGQPWLEQAMVGSGPARLFAALGMPPDSWLADPAQAGIALAARLRDGSETRYGLANLGEIPRESDAIGRSPLPVLLAVAGPNGTATRQISVSGAAERRFQHIAAQSLDLLRQRLIGKP